MDVELLSVDVASPANEIGQGDALALAQRICCIDERQRRFAKVLYEHSGVVTRRAVLPLAEADRWAPTGPLNSDGSPNRGPGTGVRMDYYREYALPLACQAAERAIKSSACQPTEITHVVTASCTGFTAPGIDLGLIGRLMLAPTTQRVHVGYMGCHGAINALRVAQGLAHVLRESRILVCAVELCTIHYAFEWSNERMLGNALFADGAGAAVLGAVEAASRRNRRNWRLAATGSYVFPNTADAMLWTVGDYGFEMSISSELPRLIEANLAAWLANWLKRNGVAVSDVNSWAVHPGGPRILEAVQTAMGLCKDQLDPSREVLAAYGNMSSATVLFVLKSLLDRNSQPPCLLLGFGPGLVAEAALFL